MPLPLAFAIGTRHLTAWRNGFEIASIDRKGLVVAYEQ